MKRAVFWGFLLTLFLLQFGSLQGQSYDIPNGQPLRSYSPNPCGEDGIHPFCTDENPYGVTFASGTTGNASSYLGSFNYSCLYTTPNPAWYYMQISNPGDLLIHIQQTSETGSGLDVDFICWGPFSASSQSDFVENLCNGTYNSGGNVVDCSYSAQSTETCYIPNAQQGQWYLLLITNYSGQPGFITFSPVNEYSTATTNCNLLTPISYNAPLCDGDTMILTCENPQEGGTYHWSGPGGWSAVTTDPYVTIPDVNTSLSGQYSLIITGLNTVVDSAHVNVTVTAIPQVTVTASADTICNGSRITLRANGATTYHWSSISGTASTLSVRPRTTTTYIVTGTTNGCSSTDTCQVTVMNSTTGDTTAVVCDSFDWYEHVGLTESGDYTHTLTNAAGCDSIVTLHLTVGGDLQDLDFYDTICRGESYDNHGFTLTGTETDTSGTLTLIHTDTSNGCTFTTTLMLTVLESPSTTITQTACENYTWGDTTYRESGTYTKIFHGVSGCDSTVTLQLTINHAPEVTIAISSNTICQGDSVILTAVVTNDTSPEYSYLWSTGETTASIVATPEQETLYTVRVSSDPECPSTDTIRVVPGSASSFASIDIPDLCIGGSYIVSAGYDSTCNLVIQNHNTSQAQENAVQITIDGPWVTTTNDSTFVITPPNTLYADTVISYTLHCYSGNGCAFDTTVNVSFFAQRYVEKDTSACDSILWEGTYYYADTVLHDTLTSVHGCDSVVTVHLTVHPAPDIRIVSDPDPAIICAGDEVTLTAVTECPGSETILYEGFDALGHGNTSSSGTDGPGNTELIFPSDELTDAFVSGNKVYPAGGAVKLGTSSIGGNITSNYLDLTQDFTVTIRAKGWIFNSTPRNTVIKVSTNQNDAQYITVNGNSDFEDYILAFSAVGSNAQVTIETTTSTGGDRRAFIDYVEIARDITCTYHWYTSTDTLGIGTEISVTPQSTNWYYFSAESPAGCMSLDSVEVVVNHTVHTSVSETACESFTWTDGDERTYTESGDYYFEHPDRNGCLQVDTLHLTIHNPQHTAVTDTAYDSFTWRGGDGRTYTESGDYIYSHEDENGCTQVDTLHLTIYNSSEDEFSAVACEFYEWDGVIYDRSGTYTREYLDSHGADSTMTLHLTINHGTHNIDVETACENYVWHRETYTESGVFTYEYQNADGCPSADTLYLTVFYPDHTASYETACESFTWTDGDRRTYTESGDYYFEHPDRNGCLQVDTLYLTIHNPQHTAVTDTAYDSFTWWDGDGRTYTASGDYTYSHEDENGCTQVDTLHLTIYYTSNNEFQAVACEFYEWDGVIYNLSGTYTREYLDSHGADSTVTLHLTVNYGTYNVEFETACESFVWYDSTYTESGDYIYEYQNADSCPSADTLYLTVFYPDHTATYETVCESYTWYDGDGETYTESGDYYFGHLDENGCTQVDTLYLTVNYSTYNVEFETACESFVWYDSIYTESGDYIYEYQNADGCPSADTLYLTIFSPDHTAAYETACESYTWYDGDGETYTESGDYYFEHLDENGCIQVDTLYLTVNYSTYNVEFETACESFVWYDSIYTESGDYIYEYQNADDCPSADTLYLTIFHPDHTATYETACESYTWYDGDGETYTESGDYYFEHLDENNCTQVDTLYLTIFSPDHTAVTDTAYDSFTWWDGDGRTYTMSGDYTFSHEDENGCTQVDTLHLTIYYSSDNEFSAVACEFYEWDSVIYNLSGTYTREYLDSHGADSTVTLHLTVNYGTHNVETETACESFIWHDSTYTESGTFFYEYQNADGCPSTDTLHLTINYAKSVQFADTACESYIWNDSTYLVSGDYTQTFTAENNCDSVVTLHLTVNHAKSVQFADTACESYTWNDSTYLVSGDYTQTFTAENNCDSVVTLHLTVNYAKSVQFADTACESYTWNDSTYLISGDYTQTFTAENGCDSVVTLHLTVNYAKSVQFADTACESYTWNDSTYTLSGDYTQTFTAENNCDSVVTLHLTINHAKSVQFADTACENYTWNDSTYTLSGDYTQTFTAENNCDSVVTLHLTVNYAMSIQFADTACESYTWNDSTYLVSGDYTQTFTAGNNCDSVVTLHLTVNYPQHTAVTDTAYDSFTWINGITYTMSGNYTYSHEDENGCTQVDTLHLTIYYSSDNEFQAVACESYEWDGVTYDTSGVYTREYFDIHGADSTMTLHLTVHHGTHNVETETACESFIWHDSTHIESGTFIYEYQNADGCPSADTLHLTVNYAKSVQFADTVCESYTWNDSTYTVSGDYTQTFTAENNCDSVVTLHLTVNYAKSVQFADTACESYIWNDSTYLVSGDYTQTFTAENNCDSVVTLHLTVNYAKSVAFADTACESYIWNDSTYLVSGDYNQTFTAGNGCDSVVTLHLTVNYPQHTAVTDTAYDSFTWINGITYTMSGDYTYSHEDENGCTQVDTLHLTIYYSSDNEFQAVACEFYEWDGITYDTSGVYTREYLDSHGADSTVTLHLTVNYGTHNVETETACESFVWHDSTYTESGIFTYEYQNTDGCPSADTLYLTVNLVQSVQFTETACESYTWNDSTYTVSGDYTQTFTAENSCDSVVTLHLTINHTMSMQFADTACESYTWNDSTYFDSGDYTQTFTTGNNCDSVVTLHLTINHSYPTHDTLYLLQNQLPYYFAAADTTIPSGSPTAFQFSYTISAQDACDTTVIEQVYIYMNYSAVFDTLICAASLPLHWHGHTFTSTSTVTDSLLTTHGADSVLTYSVTVDMLSANVDNVTHIDCYGQSTGAADVTISGGTSPLTCRWTNDSESTVSNTTHISNQSAGDYTFTVNDAKGCLASVSVTLNTLHGEMDAGTISGPQTFCSGDSLGLFTGTEASGDECVYQWQISTDGSNWEAAPNVNNTQNYHYKSLASSNFKLRRAWINDDCGTLYSNILDVSVIDMSLQIVSLTSDFCEEMVAELTVETNLTDYEWSTGEQTPTITVTDPGYYTVTATQNGCSATAGYTIEACTFNLYLPNAITPGQGDGLNDYFSIDENAKNSIALFEISIFNRWGEQVFYSNDKNFRWNGEIKGKTYHQNVYTYVIRYTDNVGKPYQVTGSITVL